jgi:hypothetical protein
MRDYEGNSNKTNYSRHPNYLASLAQLVRHESHDLKVLGSRLYLGYMFFKLKITNHKLINLLQ